MRRSLTLLAILSAITLSSSAFGQTAPLSPEASDPLVMGWMQGSPTPDDKKIEFADGGHYTFPKTRWSFSHLREFAPTRNIWRGADRPTKLRTRLDPDIDGVMFTPLGGGDPMSWAESLAVNYTDSILVMHKGRVVYERYLGVAAPEKPHISFSVTKSYFGTMAAMLAHEGKLDTSKNITEYLPELAGTAFENATVQQALDMTTGIAYSEDYRDPNAEVFKFAYSGGFLPAPQDYKGPQSYHDFLKTLKPEGQHGAAYSYESVNTEVIGWIIRRITGAPPEQMLSERIWQKIGAEQDAYIMVDSQGTGFAAGGLNTTLRDHARFGEMMRRGGRYNGQQIVPKSIIDDIRAGSDRVLFSKAGYKTLPNWSYRNQWWVSHNDHGVFSARGIHGQTIYIDPKAEMVIVRFASHPLAGNANFDPTSLPAFRAVAEHLMDK